MLADARAETTIWNPEGRFGFDGDILTFEVEGKNLVVSETGAQKIASTIGIYGPYISKCPAPLAAANLNYWRRVSYKGTHKFLLTDDTILNVARILAPDPDPEEVLSCIEKGIGTDIVYDYVYSNADEVELRVRTPAETVIKPGDPYSAGLSLRYSQTEHIPVTIEGYNLRLVCTNGMIRPDLITKMSRKTPVDEFISWMLYSTEQVWAATTSQFQELLSLSNIKIPTEGRATFVEHVLKEYGIPRIAHQDILDMMLAEPIETMYDLMNIITYVGTHTAHERRTRRALQSAGGAITTHYELCDTCHRVLN